MITSTSGRSAFAFGSISTTQLFAERATSNADRKQFKANGGIGASSQSFALLKALGSGCLRLPDGIVVLESGSLDGLA
jgi:hypothetical protein